MSAQKNSVPYHSCDLIHYQSCKILFRDVVFDDALHLYRHADGE